MSKESLLSALEKRGAIQQIKPNQNATQTPTTEKESSNATEHKDSGKKEKLLAALEKRGAIQQIKPNQNATQTPTTTNATHTTPKKWAEPETPKQATTFSKKDFVDRKLQGANAAIDRANENVAQTFKKHDGVIKGDGIHFPTTEGVNAYNKALQNRDSIAYQAYADTANRAYAKTMQQAEEARARQPEKDRPAFEMLYSKSAAGQTYALAQAIEEYNSAYAARVAFETKNNYSGKEYRWNTGKAEEQHEALIAKEEEAYSKMRQARANLYNTDVDESDAYYQLVDNEYKRAAEMHGLDGYLEANNLKTIYRGDDSKTEAQMREEINGGVYKKHSAAVSRFQDWIGKYDENIKRLQSDGSVDSAKLWQDQSQKLFYELEDKRELIEDGKLPEAGSKSDWAYFIAAAKTQDDFSDYAKVDPQIATPKMKEGYKKEPSGNNATNYPTTKKRQAKSKAEALFFEVNGAEHQSTVFSGLPSYMSDDEVEVFNYFYQNKKFGPDAALTYYNEILPDLKQRRSNEFDYKEASRRAKEAQFGGYASSLLYSGLTGFANAVLGIVQWIPGTEDWNKTNTMAAHELQRNQSYWQRIGSGAAQSIGGMLPSIMAGNYLGTAASLGTTFLSSGGSAAAEGRKMGMGGWQAAAYGAQVGAAEAGLQYALSGIPGLKKIGNVWDKVAASATTNAGKIATRFAGGIAGEVIEENLQNYIEPAAKCLVGFEAWEDYDAPTVQDFIDTTLSTILASGIMSGINLKNDAALTRYESETVKPWVDDALKIAKPDTSIYKIAKEIKNKMDNGERITPNDFNTVRISALAEDVSQETARLMTEKELTATRAAQVQEANPDALVVTSSAAQSYLDSGMSLQMASNAAEVLDKIIAGEITSENLSSANIDKLQLHVPAMAAVAAKTMGVELPKITTKAEAKNAFKNAIRQYEANKTAQDSTGQVEFEAGQTIEEQTDTFEDKDVLLAQPQILPTEDVTESVVQPVRESQPVRVPQVRAEGTMSFTNFYNELSAVNGSKINGDTAMTDYFDLYKQRVAADPSFMSPAAFAQNYRAEHPKATPKEVMQAYRDYLSPSRSVERQDYSEFAEEYKKTHPDANINELALAYQNYLDGDVKHDAKQTEQYGVIEDEYSAQVEPQFVEAVDALAKLFKTNIRFAELGEDNGKFDPNANEILLDIHPDKMFVQVAGHEITHQLKKIISEAAWANFEKYAVKAMGGDAAVKAKQNFHKAYAKPEVAREEVACDFVGKLLSDKKTLQDFCYAVEHKQVRSETVKWLINTCKWFVGKFTNKP
ncbi:MAG: hypothetical protein IKM38_04735, partial [Christensenellaceae bacterium]|nr:hypothetical protein [Christensenellaceae bacterium]